MFRLGMGAYAIRRKFVKVSTRPHIDDKVVQADTINGFVRRNFGAARISWMRICRR